MDNNYFENIEKNLMEFKEKTDSEVYDLITSRYSELEYDDNFLFCLLTAYNVDAICELTGADKEAVINKVRMDLLAEGRYRDYMVSLFELALDLKYGS